MQMTQRMLRSQHQNHGQLLAVREWTARWGLRLVASLAVRHLHCSTSRRFSAAVPSLQGCLFSDHLQLPEAFESWLVQVPGTLLPPRQLARVQADQMVIEGVRE
jgi:hypothetical protein